MRWRKESEKERKERDIRREIESRIKKLERKWKEGKAKTENETLSLKD